MLRHATDRRSDSIGISDRIASEQAIGFGRNTQQAKLAYQLFRERFAGDRWDALAAVGAYVQRPLWVSTSTKNPTYSDTLYVDNLIARTL
jgi:transaldolase